MCGICRDFDNPDKHFCGDAHGANFGAWCEQCINELTYFVANGFTTSEGQTMFPFALAEEDDEACYSLRQVSTISPN